MPGTHVGAHAATRTSSWYPGRGPRVRAGLVLVACVSLTGNGHFTEDNGVFTCGPKDAAEGARLRADTWRGVEELQ
eukprot:3156141-Rhodomonas_salina.1